MCKKYFMRIKERLVNQILLSVAIQYTLLYIYIQSLNRKPIKFGQSCNYIKIEIIEGLKIKAIWGENDQITGDI